MADNSLLGIFANSFINQYKRPQTESASGFNPDSAFGANMVNRSNEMNPNPMRDGQNALVGASPKIDAFKSLLGGTSESVASGLGEMAPGVASAGLPMLGRLIGGGVGADVGGATASVGSAAAQGGMNPMADVGAGISLFKLLRRLF